MSKHTPGPWKKAGGNDSDKIFSATRHIASVIGTTRGRTINPHHSESQANARLIATAPALLQEAENLIRFFMAYRQGCLPYPHECEKFKAALNHESVSWFREQMGIYIGRLEAEVENAKGGKSK